MGTPIIDDDLWALIEPLLPPPKPRRKKYPGRRPVSDRVALNGILFVFKTGMRWCDLSIKLGFGSGPICWRRLRDWQKVGVWERLHELLLAKLREAGQLDFSRAAVDSSSVRAVGAREKLARAHGSLATRFQAPHPRRCQWRPRQCHLSPAASEAKSHLRRLRLGLRTTSPETSQTRHQAGDRKGRDRARQWTSANFAWWLSVLTHDSTTLVVFAFALSGEPTFTKIPSNSVAPSSAGTSSDVRSSLFETVSNYGCTT